jgi:GAF domain-containing protein/HAMP domain-containing protein
MDSKGSSPLFVRFSNRTGGWYPIFGLIFSQLLTGPLGLFMTAAPVAANTTLGWGKIFGLLAIAALLMVIRDILLLVLMYNNSKDMFFLLSKQGKAQAAYVDAVKVQRAWKQVTSFPWRYIAYAYSALILFVLFPVMGYMSYYLHASGEEMVYVFIASLASATGLALTEILLIDFWLNAIRPALIPPQYEAQLAGVKGLRFRPKFQLSITALVMVTILLVVPVGYRQSTLMLYSIENNPGLLNNVLMQLALASAGGLIFGIVVASIIGKSLSDPVLRVIDTLRQVEAGDLGQRIKIISTDETGEMAIYFNKMIERLQVSQGNLENTVQQRTKALTHQLSMLQTASAVARIAAEQQDYEPLFNKTIDSIVDQLGYYHASIYMVEEDGETLLLKASATEGKRLGAKQADSIKINRNTVIGNTAYLGKTYVAGDISQEPGYQRNPDLPFTLSEAAIPIRIQNKTIGVLDIQSNKPQSFSAEDISAFETLAYQVALAVKNIQLENEKDGMLRQIDSFSTEGVRKTWESHLRQQRKAYRYTPTGVSPSTTSKPSLSSSGDIRQMDMPISLRGQKIGTVTFHRKKEAAWTDADKSLAREIADQVALALENARLLDETRQRAVQEQTINELTGRFSRSLDPDVLLQSALRELHRLPNVAEVSVYLTSPDTGKKE